MPNHVENIITFKGDKKKILEMLEAIKSNDYGLGTVDFNKITPMPESLNIEAGSRTDRGLKAYTFNHFQESLYNLFRFNEQQIKFLWDLFIKNSEELQTAILLSVFSMCQSTRAEVQKLIEFFKNIFNEDDEEDDEKEMESGIC